LQHPLQGRCQVPAAGPQPPARTMPRTSTGDTLPPGHQEETHEMSTTSTTTNPNQALWEKGDFTRIAASMRESGEDLVRRIGVTPGSRVLDLGSGDGTTAIPAARVGADVLAVDIARNLVEAGQRRADAEGVTNVRFQQGDAVALADLADDTFDLSQTIFGAMFAPKPFDVARELVRVTKPGGRVVMGNWIPGDPTLVAQILRISAAYSPPPPEGFVSPMTWGQPEHVVERFVAAGVPASAVTCEPDTFVFETDATPTEFLETFRSYYGPTMNAFDAARSNGKEKELEAELVDLFEKENRSGEHNRTVIPATYLRVTVKK